MEEKKQFQVKASLDEFNYIFNYIRKISNEVRIVFHDYVFNYYALCYVNRCKFFFKDIPFFSTNCFTRLALNYCFENCIRSIRVFCQCPRE